MVGEPNCQASAQTLHLLIMVVDPVVQKIPTPKSTPRLDAPTSPTLLISDILNPLICFRHILPSR